MTTKTMKKQEKTVTLRDLCARRKVDPRTARRRLRNAGNNVPQPKGQRWEWPVSQVKDVLPYISD